MLEWGIISSNNRVCAFFMCAGLTAARNMLGKKEEINTVPFFWTMQFGKSVRYAGKLAHHVSIAKLARHVSKTKLIPFSNQIPVEAGVYIWSP